MNSDAEKVRRVSDLAWAWLELFADSQTVEGQMFARAARDVIAALDPGSRPYVECSNE